MWLEHPVSAAACSGQGAERVSGPPLPVGLLETAFFTLLQILQIMESYN